MEFTFDFTELYIAMDQGILASAWFLFKNGMWFFYFLIISSGVYNIWQMRQQTKWFKTNKFVILAIDIPKDTEQTPKAVEQLFSTLSGAHEPHSRKEIYWEGRLQLSFAFEIVSIDGYVQFLIRTPSHWRDLVESSIYSQYPDAEITEVEDYIEEVPDKYPNETHNIWGAEIILTNKDVYPIRTYTYFEDAVSGEFKDPIASLLETMSKIQKGEQVWIQLIVKPTGFDWPERSLQEAYKIAGKTIAKKESFMNKLISPITNLFFLSTGELFIWPNELSADTSKKNDKELPSLMLHLTPGEKSAVEAIENKASKTGFQCKIRLVYISPIEQYAPGRVVASVFGSIKQFNTMDLNAFKPDKKTKTKAEYFFPKWRANRRRERLISNYKRRSGISGHNYFILNTEELATLWHFPSKYIKAPLLQKTDSKKSEPPFSLPRTNLGVQESSDVSTDLKQQLESVESFNVDLADKHFEEKFSKKSDLNNTSSRSKNQPPSNLPIA